MECARDVLPDAEGERCLVVAGRRRVFAGEDDEAGHVGVHILNIVSEDRASIQLGRARRADSGPVVVVSFRHVFDRARGGERGHLLDTRQAAIEKTPALTERLWVRGDDADILQVNPGSRDQEMAHGQRELAAMRSAVSWINRSSVVLTAPSMEFSIGRTASSASPVSTAETSAGNDEKATS